MQQEKVIGFMSLMKQMIRKLRHLFKPTQEPVEPTQTTIWGIIDGPYLREDFAEEELWKLQIPPDAEAMLVCKVEENGSVFLANYWYESLDEAYEIKKYFDVNIEPLEITYE
jgi:hypothetical protein